ncbi:MAG TPA: TetR/AcrR family transcriptional regulator [Aggregatilinea sp.]|jgi:AcrR family transcriptional regulator|uniref:TetR/AcrR family transcriptional regulator n=1 Tax=Aggregatilinea sp. TaxID=2806333 RepID=UPI002BC5D963|nr:TetR/AcrR family transcriptional regulator [Aggregatilinea sp.]HML24098.1 TetR/AcrR family transcriptional regulator [Aggregatilinea sp.]
MARKPADQTVHVDEILYAAAIIFHRKGYQGATMADIAAEVNLTAGSLYHYFPSKEDLLMAVLDAGLSLITGKVRDVIEGDDPPADKLRAIITIHILSEIDNIHIATAVIFESRALLEVPGVREQYIRQRDTLERLYRDVIEAGIAAGDFRAVDVGIFVKTLFGALNWVNVWYREGGRLSGAEIAGEIAETFLHALTPAGGA